MINVSELTWRMKRRPLRTDGPQTGWVVRALTLRAGKTRPNNSKKLSQPRQAAHDCAKESGKFRLQLGFHITENRRHMSRHCLCGRMIQQAMNHPLRAELYAIRRIHSRQNESRAYHVITGNRAWRSLRESNPCF